MSLKNSSLLEGAISFKMATYMYKGELNMLFAANYIWKQQSKKKQIEIEVSRIRNVSQ